MNGSPKEATKGKKNTRKYNSESKADVCGSANCSMCGSRFTLNRPYASVAQLVEATDLNSVKCRFDSYPKHQLDRC